VQILVSAALEFVLGMQIDLDIEKVCCNPFFTWLNYCSWRLGWGVVLCKPTTCPSQGAEYELPVWRGGGEAVDSVHILRIRDST